MILIHECLSFPFLNDLITILKRNQLFFNYYILILDTNEHIRTKAKIICYLVVNKRLLLSIKYNINVISREIFLIQFMSYYMSSIIERLSLIHILY